ncbi:hypothetical protein ACOSP7_005438 [Xanthoceras sorbifolium]
MSAVVEIWMGELAKLSEKVTAKKKPFSSSRAQKETHFAQQENEQVEEKKAKETRQQVQEETSMSETTVCLLMDRFVPW